MQLIQAGSLQHHRRNVQHILRSHLCHALPLLHPPCFILCMLFYHCPARASTTVLPLCLPLYRPPSDAYRQAIEVSPRDYRAWYGLGQTYELLQMPYYAVYYYRWVGTEGAAPAVTNVRCPVHAHGARARRYTSERTRLCCSPIPCSPPRRAATLHHPRLCPSISLSWRHPRNVY